MLDNSMVITTRVAVGGESAGGNLATVACLKARDEGGLLPVAQMLIYPVTDSAMNTSSYQENTHTKPLNAAMMTWLWKHYLNNEARRTRTLCFTHTGRPEWLAACHCTDG